MPRRASPLAKRVPNRPSRPAIRIFPGAQVPAGKGSISGTVVVEELASRRVARASI